MSIDFDSAALQTQHDEEEYDQEDYAREQELHKLLTDLPDDMLEDSRDSSSPEPEYSPCNNKNIDNSPQSTWNRHCEWSAQTRPAPHAENYHVDYEHGADHEYAYGNGAGHPQSQPLPHTWNQQSEACQFNQGDYKYSSMGTEKSTENFDCPGSGDRRVDQYKASYNPHQPACQPPMFNSQDAHQECHFDHLQREFLDSAQNTAEREQLAQLQILNKAQQRQIEELERKLEDSRRNMRYLEHQFAIVKDEKDGLAVSLKESSRLIEEAKEREVQMQSKVMSLEQQVQALNERDHENMKKQRVAEAAVDSMKQQMLELCRSDTLSRVREQHDRDLAVMREQHEAVLLAEKQKLDSSSQALKEQTDISQRLREQLKQLERQREEDQLERAGVINTLTQRLEESQQQCAKLLQTGSVQEMSQMQIKLQQAQSAKALSENMTKVLQEDLSELKEQITIYESAVKHGVIALELNGDWENQLSESCMDLGLKRANWKNGQLHSTALADLSDPKLSKDEVLQELKAEMQRCLASLKGKRQKISHLQEELQHSEARVDELQTQLDEAQLSSSVRGTSQFKHLDVNGASQKDLIQVQQDKQHLQEKVQSLEKKNKELKQSEEKVRAANLELCTKMREMIQELDQEKQEAAERSERIQQQYRDDVVNRVRTELILQHEAQIDQLTAQHQQQIQQLQTQLSEANDKMVAVQECYISVCKEKDLLEESQHRREREEALMRENEQKMREESSVAVEKLRTELEAQHQASVIKLKALWSREKETEIQQQVASAKAAWQEELQKMESTWVRRLEEAKRAKHTETAEETCQTDESKAGSVIITVEELDSRLSAQKQRLQLEADKVKRKAVEEARKQTQRELHDKHLEDMAKQVEGAVTRAYSRWLEDLTSLPEYKATLQKEREKWEELHEKLLEQQVSQALRVAEEQWQERHSSQLEEQQSGAQRIEELQEQVAALQSQLEQVRAEQAALLKAELAGARASWTRDKQQEISIIQISEEKLSRVLKETQEHHEREIDKIQSCVSRTTEQARCGKQCAEALGKLQKKNQDLQRHLEKACRQLQQTVRQHKAAMQQLTAEHEGSLRQVKEDHLLQLEEVRRSKESSGGSENQQNLQLALEEMKQQYLMTVEKIRGDMLRYLQESKERAAEMIRSEVQRERQDTARKMRHYYLTCLQELLEDGGQATGAEKKIMNAAGKLAAMAKVLETPLKRKSVKNHSLPGSSAAGSTTGNTPGRKASVSRKPSAVIQVSEIQPEERTHRNQTDVDSDIQAPLQVRTKPLSKAAPLDTALSGKDQTSKEAGLKGQAHLPSYKPSRQVMSTSQVGFASSSLRSKSRDLYLQGGNTVKAGDHFDSERQSKPLLIQDTPVRDERQSNWSIISDDSNAGFQIPTLSYSGRKVEPVKPFSLHAPSPTDPGEFGSFTTDFTDITVYNEITKMPHHNTALNFPCTKMSTHREPTPGAEGENQQGVCSKALFSELRQHQQDSGFDSPFYQQK
ncbi:centrosomal protein of 152 kDa isoform X2 [Myripristis murdjan]|uniref:centrosomal protein of 152 kDa isoform X2 n=1 Tax=Myripristis murdjan TaxID=586833 RepID=UPI0011764419|nr:centrosomal protein of 152 kDa isoform X2 [Myripristis murdjan]